MEAEQCQWCGARTTEPCRTLSASAECDQLTAHQMDGWFAYLEREQAEAEAA